jgi:hypothetical protein
LAQLFFSALMLASVKTLNIVFPLQTMGMGKVPRVKKKGKSLLHPPTMGVVYFTPNYETV